MSVAVFRLPAAVAANAILPRQFLHRLALQKAYEECLSPRSLFFSAYF